jgi:hypothetical protein
MEVGLGVRHHRSVETFFIGLRVVSHPSMTVNKTHGKLEISKKGYHTTRVYFHFDL